MYFHEHPTNTTAHRSSSSERSRWRDAGVDPELLQDMSDVAVEQIQRPLSVDAACGVMEAAEVTTYNSALQGVQCSFERR